MKTTPTILCDNLVGRPAGVVGEHGFACLVETDAGNVRFDTGQGMGICGNADAAGKVLYSVRAVAITHLNFARPAQFDETLEAIDRFGIERVGVSHCTGLEKAALLHARLGKRFFFGCVGAELEG